MVVFRGSCLGADAPSGSNVLHLFRTAAAAAAAGAVRVIAGSKRSEVERTESAIFTVARATSLYIACILSVSTIIKGPRDAFSLRAVGLSVSADNSVCTR